jgi:hypothetical protein
MGFHSTLGLIEQPSELTPGVLSKVLQGTPSRVKPLCGLPAASTNAAVELREALSQSTKFILLGVVGVAAAVYCDKQFLLGIQAARLASFKNELSKALSS